jgi:hypothetical protein
MDKVERNDTGRNPDHHDLSCRSHKFYGLGDCLRSTHGLEDDVRPAAACLFHDNRLQVLLRRPNDPVCPELPCEVKPPLAMPRYDDLLAAECNQTLQQE